VTMQEPLATADALGRGREAYARQAWREAFTLLSAADRDGLLELADLERLGVAAYLLGRYDDVSSVLARAHNEALRLAEPIRAARNAFWLGFGLLERGEIARGGGWLARAARLVDEGQHDCVERGYLLLPGALQSLDGGDAVTASATFAEAARTADRFRDPDLATIARLGLGHALIRLADTEQGVALLDEAMVAVTAGEVSPIVVGLAYCAVIETCHEIFDLRRAQEWTAALSGWCQQQPELVPYRGQCMLYRAELMQLHGAWQDAIEEAGRAFEQLSQPNDEAVGEALYRQAELHRLHGEFAPAEAAYREAAQRGRRPEPGLALLRFAQGRVGVAAAAIRRALDEADVRAARAALLDPYVDIVIASGDLEAARAAAAELADIAEAAGAPLLRAMAARSEGALRLAEGDARSALGASRRARATWQRLDAPYEAARARVLVGIACRELGDEDAAEMELDSARRVFAQLGARPDLARLDALDRKPRTPARSGLTTRELEVLRLVASGRTNRAIAADLFISEKTVARHVANIFTKLGTSSRSAATAYAYEHGIVSAST
jgi:DNA-binding CsgD family transcriptional regulator